MNHLICSLIDILRGTFSLKMSFHNLSISVLKVGRHTASLLVVAAFFTSCIKEETPVPTHLPGNVTTHSVNMESNYRNQVYYSFEQDSVLSTNLKSEWDLSFGTAADDYIIGLNTSKYMFARQIAEFDLNTKSDTLGFFKNRQWDASNTPDSLSIGDARKIKQVVILDMGTDEKGIPQGFKKILVSNLSISEYKVSYSNLDGTDKQTINIPRDTTYAHVHLSIKNNKILKVEPPKQNWDIVFTQYEYTFYDPYLPYLVTGVLLNKYQTSVAADSTTAFSAIDMNTVAKARFTTAPDVIGFDWKVFNFTTYITRPNKNYIIRNSKGIYYKMHFIDFFNDKGVKGNPKFEFQRL
jgi:hypothetical protein